MNALTPIDQDRAERTEKLQGMGCKRKRVEDIRFTQGKGSYVDDLKLPGMLFGDFVRSPHAHARIKSIDKSKALALPGVVLPRISFVRQTTDAIQRSRAMIVLISPSALSSEDFSRQLTEAVHRKRVVVPLLTGISREEFETLQPAWRPLLGSITAMEVDARSHADAVADIAATLESYGILRTPARQAEKNAPSNTVAVQRTAGLHRQVWATDSSQIDVHDLPHVVFRNPLVDEFLNRRNKYFLSGTKGLGKTLLLSYKRHLLSQSRSSDETESALCFVPQGRPYLDFMSELKSLSARYESTLADLTTTKRFWSMALRVSAISNHLGCIDADEEDELHAFPARFRRWLKGSRIEPTVVFKELTNLSVSQANALVDDTETFLRFLFVQHITESAMRWFATLAKMLPKSFIRFRICTSPDCWRSSQSSRILMWSSRSFVDLTIW